MASNVHEDSSSGIFTMQIGNRFLANELPSVKSILSNLEAPASLVFPTEPTESSIEKEGRLLQAVKTVLSKTEGVEEGQEEQEEPFFDVQELQSALETADGDVERQGIHSILQELWNSRSKYLVEAAEALANASRDPSWRIPFGRSGVLSFFLQLVATREETSTNLIFHSLRLIGNSCADTDDNRETVVSGKHTISIMRLLDPDLVHITQAGLTSVIITVLYNLCTDFEPAQAQVAAFNLGYILLKLLNDGILEGNNFAYDLLEMTTGQVDGIKNSPDGTIQLIMNMALDENALFAQFAFLVSCLTTYLQNEQFQTTCVRQKQVEQVVSVLRRSFGIQIDESSTEEVQLLAQLRLKLNQALADISAVPEFLEVYPIGSPLLKELQSWLSGPEESLQICACVILGNVARTDEICRLMIDQLGIHKSLIEVLKSNTRGGVLHAVLGFLKNLAIAESNRDKLGDADIIPAVSRVWSYDSVPQVQLAATSVTRLLVASSMKNISLLLGSSSTVSDPESPDDPHTYLSILLSLCNRTDTAPIKTEIGRTVSSICRTLLSRPKGVDEATTALLDRLFDLHEEIAHPVGAMITQKEWPVVKSEGWFALALMASNTKGSVAVVKCLDDSDVYAQVEKGLELIDNQSESTMAANEQLQIKKNRDNLVIMVKELMGNNPANLSEAKKARLTELMNNAISTSLQNES